MSRYELTDDAANDLGEIFLQGILNFGLVQAERYKDDLERCFGLLATHPRMGRRADRFAAGTRRHEHGSHVIFYEQMPYGIQVIAIVHERAIRRLMS